MLKLTDEPGAALDLQNRVCRELGLPVALWAQVSGQDYSEMRRSASDALRRYQSEKTRCGDRQSPTDGGE